MIKQIVLANEPILRRKLKLVKSFDTNLRLLAQDMIDTMTFANGAGLAANQVGIDQQIFVTGLGPRPQIFINPKLKVLKSKDSEIDEGCLSVPGFRGPVKRSQELEITFNDLKGKRKKLHINGYLARVIQHEMDHLQGKLYIDHIKDRSKIREVAPIKVVFFGSGEFAIPILVSLVGLNWTFDFQTIGVVTQPPKPAGRKKDLQNTPIYNAAKHFNLPVLIPDNLDAEFLKKLKKWGPELIVLSDYGKILPKELIAIPKYGCLNIHPSLLPKYRGASPIQASLLNGDSKTGVTLMKISPEVDAGGIIGQYETEIREEDTFLTLREKLAQLGGVILRDLLPYYISEEIKPIAQSEEAVVKAPKITPDLGKITPQDSNDEIIRKVKALNPDPGVYTVWNNKRIKIIEAHLENGEIILEKLQPEGGKEMNWNEFKNGYRGFSLKPDLSN